MLCYSSCESTRNDAELEREAKRVGDFFAADDSPLRRAAATPIRSGVARNRSSEQFRYNITPWTNRQRTWLFSHRPFLLRVVFVVPS